jgi:hypothetical protein
MDKPTVEHVQDAVTRIIAEANEAHEMLRQVLDALSEAQGKLQACEEIIFRTRVVVTDLDLSCSLSDYARTQLLTALGPAAQ